ncbi:hypothetical protein ACWD3Z_42065 [Streptomyces sp. NPDC002740]
MSISVPRPVLRGPARGLPASSGELAVSLGAAVVIADAARTVRTGAFGDVPEEMPYAVHDPYQGSMRTRLMGTTGLR